LNISRRDFIKSYAFFSGAAFFRVKVLADTALHSYHINYSNENWNANGKTYDTLWMPPFTLDATDTVKSGKNKLKVLVTSTTKGKPRLGKVFQLKTRNHVAVENKLAVKKYSDGRPAATLRMDAKDQGIVLIHGDGPGKRLERLGRENINERLRQQEVNDYRAGSIELLQGDFKIKGQEIPDNSVDVIFNDPPYDKASLYLWSQLGCLAKRALKPGGLLLSYSGCLYINQIFAKLDDHLEYLWTAAIYHSGAKK